ncbi:hypothetical protein CBR_g45424 [Chara braunii]|uniref:CCHC-type domain-containing protein n=1 Tax=Chara braunii TaxID=69332 RepID=A0A388LYG6_CHABU|nr:hypothetical protein CBR_g45424 [Chara braunii]|eukprot:GBG87364.1 hypothetical protein CBR_g45424 [Chara braunii]
MSSSSQAGGSRDGNGPRCNQPVCYSCNLPGYYARDCGAYWKERFEGKRGDAAAATTVKPACGRSASPVRKRWEPSRRSPSADLRYQGRRNEDRDSVKELVSLLMAEREEKEMAKKEEEERVNKEKERKEKEERRLKKEEKKRREQQENDERVAKIVNMQFSRKWGGAMERMGPDSSPETSRQHRRYRKASRRGRRHRRTAYASVDSDDLSEISEQTRKLSISEKRKRPSTVTEDSSSTSPSTTPLKLNRARDLYLKSPVRSAPRAKPSSAKKMKTTLQATTLKKLREKSDPAVKGAARGQGAGSRNQFVKDILEYLDGLDYCVVQKMCKKEKIRYVRKGQAIAALAEKRAHVAYEGTKDGLPEYAKGKEESTTSSESSDTKILQSLYDQEKKHRKFVLSSEGGNAWCDGWKSVKRVFGNSEVLVDGNGKLLRHCKKDLEEGRTICVEYLKRWKKHSNWNHPFLISILKHFKKRVTLRFRDLKFLVELLGAINEFLKKTTRQLLKRILYSEIRLGYGFKLGTNVVPRVRFDDRISLAGLRRLCDEKINNSVFPKMINDIYKTGVRVVWTKNPSIADILCNYRKTAAGEVQVCCCRGYDLPRQEGHVRCRLGEIEGLPDGLKNGRNIPKAHRNNREESLVMELSETFLNWKLGVRADIHGERKDVAGCFKQSKADINTISTEEVLNIQRRFSELVLTVVDRNAGEIVVMCPQLYYEAMCEMFVRNSGYVICLKEEEEVWKEARLDLKQAGLAKLGRWDIKGKAGKSYVLPKHKDLSQFRPIGSTFCEPTIRICKKVSKALNLLLNSIPSSCHFNLPAVSQMADKIKKANAQIQGAFVESGVMATCYDIKDMFSKLPHDEILRSLDWVISCFPDKKVIRVNPRGKGASFGEKKGEGWWAIDIRDVRKFLKFELSHTYTRATNVLLRQVVGIPMGKSTSPPLACMMCAHVEWRFLVSLGCDRKLVFGMRLMDDVSLLLIFRKGDRGSICRANEICQRFKNCYPRLLTLKRTDEKTGSWEFIGCRLNINQQYPFLSSVQATKNQQTIWGPGPVVFRTRQDSLSWADVKQKKVAITGWLCRIDRNTTDRAAIPKQVLTLRREYRAKGFSDEFFGNVVRNFAPNRGRVWQLVAEIVSM